MLMMIENFLFCTRLGQRYFIYIQTLASLARFWNFDSSDSLISLTDS